MTKSRGLTLLALLTVFAIALPAFGGTTYNWIGTPGTTAVAWNSSSWSPAGPPLVGADGDTIIFGASLYNLNAAQGDIALGTNATVTSNGVVTWAPTGSQKISGNAFTKNGMGILTIAGSNSTANNFTGVMTVSNGVLGYNYKFSWGAVGAGNETRVNSGATLMIGASINNEFTYAASSTLPTSETVYLNGTGFSNLGALYNNTTGYSDLAWNLSLESASTINTRRPFGLGDSGVGIFGTVQGNYKLTKTGRNTLLLLDRTGTSWNNNPNASIDIAEGITKIEARELTSGSWTIHSAMTNLADRSISISATGALLFPISAPPAATDYNNYTQAAITAALAKVKTDAQGVIGFTSYNGSGLTNPGGTSNWNLNLLPGSMAVTAGSKTFTMTGTIDLSAFGSNLWLGTDGSGTGLGVAEIIPSGTTYRLTNIYSYYSSLVIGAGSTYDGRAASQADVLAPDSILRDEKDGQGNLVHSRNLIFGTPSYEQRLGLGGLTIMTAATYTGATTIYGNVYEGSGDGNLNNSAKLTLGTFISPSGTRYGSIANSSLVDLKRGASLSWSDSAASYYNAAGTVVYPTLSGTTDRIGDSTTVNLGGNLTIGGGGGTGLSNITTKEDIGPLTLKNTGLSLINLYRGTGTGTRYILQADSFSRSDTNGVALFSGTMADYGTNVKFILDTAPTTVGGTFGSSTAPVVPWMAAYTSTGSGPYLQGLVTYDTTIDGYGEAVGIRALTASEYHSLAVGDDWSTVATGENVYRNVALTTGTNVGFGAKTINSIYMANNLFLGNGTDQLTINSGLMVLGVAGSSKPLQVGDANNLAGTGYVDLGTKGTIIYSSYNSTGAGACGIGTAFFTQIRATQGMTFVAADGGLVANSALALFRDNTYSGGTIFAGKNTGTIIAYAANGIPQNSDLKFAGGQLQLGGVTPTTANFLANAALLNTQLDVYGGTKTPNARTFNNIDVVVPYDTDYPTLYGANGMVVNITGTITQGDNTFRLGNRANQSVIVLNNSVPANAVGDTGRTIIGGGALAVARMDQLSSGNLIIENGFSARMDNRCDLGGVMVLSGAAGNGVPTWSQFTAARAYGTGDNQWQLQGGGFAAKGAGFTISGLTTSTFDGNFTLGNAAISGFNGNGTPILFSDAPVTIAQNTVVDKQIHIFAAPTGPGTVYAAGTYVANRISGNFSGTGSVQVIGYANADDLAVKLLSETVFSGSNSWTGSATLSASSGDQINAGSSVIESGPGGMIVSSKSLTDGLAGGLVRFDGGSSLPTGNGGLPAFLIAHAEMATGTTNSNTGYLVTSSANGQTYEPAAGYKFVIGTLTSTAGKAATGIFGSSSNDGTGGTALVRNATIAINKNVADAVFGLNLLVRDGTLTLGETGKPVTFQATKNTTWGANDEIFGVANVLSDDTTSAARTMYKIGTGTLALSNVVYQNLAGTTIAGNFTWDIQKGKLLVNQVGTDVAAYKVRNAATLGGTGSVANVTVDAGGIVAPGASIGNLAVTNGLTLPATAVLSAEMGDMTSDQLNVTGTLDITGSTLAVTLLSPLHTKNFTLATATALTGTFGGLDQGATVSLTYRARTYLGTISYLNNQVTLNVPTASIPGDANFDGAVNFTDYLALEQSFNAAPSGNVNADFDCSGLVTFTDYLTLEQNFNTVASSVPEPMTLTLLGLGALALIRRRR